MRLSTTTAETATTITTTTAIVMTTNSEEDEKERRADDAMKQRRKRTKNPTNKAFSPSCQQRATRHSIAHMLARGEPSGVHVRIELHMYEPASQRGKFSSMMMMMNNIFCVSDYLRRSSLMREMTHFLLLDRLIRSRCEETRQIASAEVLPFVCRLNKMGAFDIFICLNSQEGNEWNIRLITTNREK
jgi:hypothetical protein